MNTEQVIRKAFLSITKMLQIENRYFRDFFNTEDDVIENSIEDDNNGPDNMIHYLQYG